LSTQKERLINVIDRYESEIINPKITDIKWLFGFQIFYYILLIAFTLIILIEPTLSNIIGSIGLSGLGVSSNWSRMLDTLKQFMKDRRILRASVTLLRSNLELCEEADTVCLQEVEDLVKDVFVQHSINN